jgi:hypothetical protein
LGYFIPFSFFFEVLVVSRERGTAGNKSGDKSNDDTGSGNKIQYLG